MGLFSSHPKNFVKEPKKGWDARHWASKIPFKHPENFFEVFRAAWENRDNLAYANRILQDGVCDGCALGTSGMNDWTVEGIHLCNIRLRLLRLNTMGPLDISLLKNVAALKTLRSRDLRDLGRLPYPMIRKKGDQGFRRLGWDEAIALISSKIQESQPQKTYYYLTSRGIPNETYYAAQKAVRAMGTNNIDNAARICHSPSTFGLKASLGVAATTCSYTDMIGTDLISFIGSNPAKNQPLVLKYLYHAKKAGTKVAFINPYFEPGMDAYWVPSDAESALFGTKISDAFFQVKVGGDMAFLHATLKAMIEEGWLDDDFIAEHTEGFADLQAYLESLTWEMLESESGCSRSTIFDYAKMIKAAEKAIFVWGMGITQHSCGEDNVHAIVNLALSKGFVGREGCGLMPIRGHSGVQGGAEMGAYAKVFPGGIPVSEASAADLSEHYGFEVPSGTAYTTPEMLDAARDNKIDLLFAVGGNFREVMPDPHGVDDALRKIPLRVHMDICLSSQMLTDPADTVILLPAITRYEMPGGCTETSTERRVIYSPEIPGPRIGEARSEWEVLGEIAEKVKPELKGKVRFLSTAEIREDIAKVIPFYAPIAELKQKGDSFQYGGDMLCKDYQFPTETGKAHFKTTKLPQFDLKRDEFMVVTRRGKQFNGMVHEDKDSLNKLSRDAIMIARTDAERLGYAEGESVVVSSDFGKLEGKLVFSDLASQSLQVFWPEGNVLLDPQARSPLATIPAFKEVKAKLHKAQVLKSQKSPVSV
ncbi:MAG: FdhF/YdeP family oxidoreductase [Trueperaceae bacterium]|nr:FdhF/YdeP family oxidoreductase [Trueperaceae bacterium]